MTNQTREIAEKMIAGGWRVVPIKPREKVPDGGNGWQGKTFAPTDFAANNGVGVMTGHGVFALDIDSYDPDVASAIADEAKRRFGKTLERIGQAPKVALFYRGLDGRKKIETKLAPSTFKPADKTEKVEVLCKGQQCVAFGIHPDTGQPYEWVGLEPWDSFLGVVECLPEVTEPDLQAFLDWVQTNYSDGDLLRQKPKLSEQAVQNQPTISAGFCEVEEAKELLSYIPADCGYDDWLSVLMGVHSHFEGAQEGLDLVDAWSAQGVKYKPGEVAQKWNSFSGQGVNWETIPALARQNGADLSAIARKHKAPKQVNGAKVDLSQFKMSGPEIAERQSQFFQASDLANKNIPPREWLVNGLVPMHTVSSLYGDGGTGKSLVALQMAVAVAHGSDWLKQTTKHGNALFISAEDDTDELHRRMADVAGSLSLDLADLPDLHMRSLAGEDALLAVLQKDGSQAPTVLFAEIDRYTQETNPRLVVLDTLADLFPGNENDRTQARQFIGLLRGLAIRHRCAVLLLAHPSLSGINSGTGSGGNTAWSNSVRSRLYLERVTIKDNGLSFEPDPDVRTLGNKKANYGRAGGELSLKWENGVFVAQEQPTGLDAVAADHKAERVFLDLLRSFSEQGRTVNDKTASTYAPTVFSKHPDSQDISKRLFTRAMESLLSSKKIKLVEEGPPSKRRTRLEVV